MCSAQRRTAKYLPPIYLERGKMQLSAVRFAPHARQRNFPPVHIYFPRNIGDGGKIWNPGQYICRDFLWRITGNISLPCGFPLPCVYCPFCRDVLFAVRRRDYMPCLVSVPWSMCSLHGKEFFAVFQAFQAHGRDATSRQNSIFR